MYPRNEDYDLKIDADTKYFTFEVQMVLYRTFEDDQVDELEKFICANPMLTTLTERNSGRTLLHLAISDRATKSVRLLVERFQMNIHTVNRSGHSAMWYAIKMSQEPNELLNFVLGHADLNPTQVALNLGQLSHINDIFFKFYTDPLHCPMVLEMAMLVTPFFKSEHFPWCPALTAYLADSRFICTESPLCIDIFNIVMLRGDPEILRVLLSRNIVTEMYTRFAMCYVESGVNRGTGEAMLEELNKHSPIFTKENIEYFLSHGMPEAIRFFIDKYDHLLRKLQVKVFDFLVENDLLNTAQVEYILTNHEPYDVSWLSLKHAISFNHVKVARYMFRILWTSNGVVCDFLRNTSIITLFIGDPKSTSTAAARIILNCIYEELYPSANFDVRSRSSLLFFIALEKLDDDPTIMRRIDEWVYTNEFTLYKRRLVEHVADPQFSTRPFHRDSVLHDLLRQPRAIVLRQARHVGFDEKLQKLLRRVPLEFRAFYEIIKNYAYDGRMYRDACEDLKYITHFPYDILEHVISYLDRKDIYSLACVRS